MNGGTFQNDRFAMTSSLRGFLDMSISVGALKNGMHSGNVSGIVTNSFGILRNLLDKLESFEDGSILIEEIESNIPPEFIEHAQNLVDELGPEYKWDFPFLSESNQLFYHFRTVYKSELANTDDFYRCWQSSFHSTWQRIKSNHNH